MSKQPVLFVFSGLPGVGKTTISKEIAILYKAVYFRIDTIEHGIEELCGFKVQGEGYRLTYRIAKDNLTLGNNVVVDCCNPYQFVRKEWKDMALGSGARCIDIEIKCSDKKNIKRE